MCKQFSKIRVKKVADSIQISTIFQVILSKQFEGIILRLTLSEIRVSNRFFPSPLTRKTFVLHPFTNFDKYRRESTPLGSETVDKYQ